MNTTRAPSFSDLLRRYRTAAGLTRETLAERAGLSVRGIADLESGARRAPYRDTVQRLSAALALDTACRQAFAAAARPPRMTPAMRGALGDAAGVSTIASPAFVVPEPPTPLIGREADMAEVRARLLHGAERLVTLTGTGGVGKTRLALELAARLRADFIGGVYFVALDALRDPVLVAPAIARILGVRETGAGSLIEAVSAFLGERHVLLVLDNFEQVLPAATVVSDLLAACARLTVVATSREPLRLRAEYVTVVDPLDLPDPAHVADPARLLRAPAVALFVTRAHAAAGGFALTTTNAGAVAELCRRLDGLPLAIELAAAGVRAASPQSILDRLRHHAGILDDGFQDLPARQQGLRAALDWSYDLLTDPERGLLARLSVFAGGCDIAAAAAVCTDGQRPTGDGRRREDRPSPVSSDALVDLLTSLVDKSLVVAEGRGEAGRYRLLETIRQYAGERLAGSGEADATQQRQVEWALDLAERAASHLHGSTQAIWLNRLDTEHDNLRAALQYTLDHDLIERGLQLAVAIQGFWRVRGHLSEAGQWLDRLLSRGTAAPGAMRATALHAAAIVSQMQGDRERARRLTEASLDLGREVGDDRLIAPALHNLGVIATDRADFAAASTYLEESLALARALGDPSLMRPPLYNLGTIELSQGSPGRAEARFQEALALAREEGDIGGQASILTALGFASRQGGSLHQAREHYTEALQVRRQLGDRAGIANTVRLLADLEATLGDFSAARAHAGEALSVAQAIGHAWGIVSAYDVLTFVARRQGDLPSARDHARSALLASRGLGDRKRIHGALWEYAAVAAIADQDAGAVRVFAASESLRESIGFVLGRDHVEEMARAMAEIRARIGETAYAVAWAEGAATAADEAVTFALQDSPPAR